MSQFRAIISDIQSEGSIHIVSFRAAGFTLKMISLTLPVNITLHSEVILGVKATAVALAKECSGLLSFSNQPSLEISKIEEGKLLTSLLLVAKDFEIESIITTASKEKMHLQEAQTVTALIKSSDLFIVEVL